eukprot:jgi/Botrbrau1/14312/Bobra.0287s0005.1
MNRNPDEQPDDLFNVPKVGKGWRAAVKHYWCPQAGVTGSQHPYGSFPGNALKWDSYVFDDASTFEGLTKEGVPHGKGVMIIGNGTGGGFQRPDPGDRYDGEWFAGFAHGLGVYAKQNGKVYKGEFTYGKRHGCGVERNMTPYFKLLEEGVDPEEAWARTQAEIDRSAKAGTWEKDYFRKSPSNGGCTKEELLGTEQETDEIMTKVRMFEYKPDGDVTFMMAQDAVGLPLPLMQDALHYPHGTKFLAPGPLGQCWPIPNDPDLLREMKRAAENHAVIYAQYNLPYEVEPGTTMGKAIELQLRRLTSRQEGRVRRAEFEKRRLKRLERKAAETDARREEAAKGRGSWWPFGRRKAAAPSKKTTAPQGKEDPKEEKEEEEDDGDVSEDDLVASTIDFQMSPQAAGTEAGRELAERFRGLPPASTFGSLTLALGGQGLGAAQCITAHLVVRMQRRRCLSRPCHPSRV